MRTLSRWPRVPSCDTRPNWFALLSADAMRSPPKTRPMTSASTITVNSRRDTGQFDRFRSREPPGLTSAGFLARLPAVTARALAPEAPWLPIAQVSLLDTRSLQAAYNDGTGRDRSPYDQPPAAHKCCRYFNAMRSEISGECGPVLRRDVPAAC